MEGKGREKTLMETHDLSNLQQNDREESEYKRETSKQEERAEELEAITIFYLFA